MWLENVGADDMGENYKYLDNHNFPAQNVPQVYVEKEGWKGKHMSLTDYVVAKQLHTLWEALDLGE